MNFNLRLIKIENQQDLWNELLSIGVSPAGCDLMVPKGLFYLLRADNLSLPAALILKQDLLSIGGEAAVHEKVIVNQVVTTSVILMATLAQYNLLADKLQNQQFGLPLLGQQIGQILNSFKHKKHVIPCKKQNLICDQRTLVMGIVNITPDSFYDGGKYFEPAAAIDRIFAMAEAGVDIIDIGGASSRPGHVPLAAAEEIERILPIIEAVAPFLQQPISVDTDKAQVAEAALAAGASIINDIEGLKEEDMMSLAAQIGAPVIIMHNSRGIEHGPDIMGEIIAFFRHTIGRAKDAGIKEEQIIIDPGLGFGKNTNQNLFILRNLTQLKSLGYPILVAASQKRFIGDVLDLPVEDRLMGSTTVAAIAAFSGANILRVHDFEQTIQALKMADAIRRGKK
ncbi:MAG: dihydropteroate synthase [Bacillota bacterium]|jgi:dihydropteroate synthase